MINHLRWLILWVCVLASGAVIAQAPPIPISNGGTGHSTGQIDLQAAFLTQQAANASSTGTTVNRLAKLTSTGAVILGTGDTSIGNLIGICASGCGTSASGTFATAGTVNADFDNATVAGDYVVASVTTGGKVHDAGATLPTGANVIGFADSTNAGGAGTYALNINPVGVTAASGGGPSKVTYNAYTSHGAYTLNQGGSTMTCMRLYGAGGGGGGGTGGASASNRGQGTGGGGGIVKTQCLPSSSISWPVTITVGTGGPVASGGSSTTGSAGNAGTDTTFGSYVTAWHGGGGAGGLAATTSLSGGGGGGSLAGGGNGSTSSVTAAAPAPNATGVLSVLSNGGGGSATSQAQGGNAEYGGSGGGGTSSLTAGKGGDSIYAGAGGGAGGGMSSGNGHFAPANGGGSGFYGTGGNGGAAGVFGVNSGRGTDGTGGSFLIGGSGGGGGDGANSGGGGDGGTGGLCGGGGGGGAGSLTTGGGGGAGGDGCAFVWQW